MNSIKAKKSMLKRYHCLFIFLFWGIVSIQGQSSIPFDTLPSHTKIPRPAFIRIGLGLGQSNFRDFATSPLYYSGQPILFSLAHVDLNKLRESHFGLSYAFGNYHSEVANQRSSSSVQLLTLNYLELFQIKRFSSDRLNIKVGGQFNTTVNVRNNPDLFNNSEGIDIIGTMSGTLKTGINFGKVRQQYGNATYKPDYISNRTQRLSLTLNIGLINSSFRNGFAYTSSAAPLNSDDFFKDYELIIFQGFRVNSSLDYTLFLKNRNALQFTYAWDVYKTAGHHDNIEMASHLFIFSLLYNLK